MKDLGRMTKQLSPKPDIRSRAYARSNPSDDDIQSAICFSPRNQKYLNKEWRCPGCDRSINEIVRWFSDKGWGYKIVLHHDHAADPLVQMDGRFPVVLICEDCNGVDGKVKRVFRELNNQSWSFAIQDIRAVISVKPHHRHMIKLDMARQLAQYLVRAYGMTNDNATTDRFSRRDTYRVTHWNSRVDNKYLEDVGG
jgi:hypothetical protein